MATMDFPEGASATIPPGSVTNAQLANMPALTVKANATGAAATPQDLAAGADNTFLARVAGALQFLAYGTAALVDTGTSGGTVPLLNTANTWSGKQTFNTGAIDPIRMVWADSGVTGGPRIEFMRDSASPAANDALGQFQMRGRDSAGNETLYALIGCLILDPTDGSEDAQLNIATQVGGAFGSRLFVANGTYGNGAVGGDQGSGTSNWTAVYDDGVIICAPFHDDMTQADWDALTVSDDGVREVTVDVVPGWFDRALEWASFGVLKTATREVKRVVRESKTGKRKHITAKRYFRMRAAGFNDSNVHEYAAYVREHKTVPGLIGIAEWSARMIDNGVVDKPSITEERERTNLALDCAVKALCDAADRIATLEARVAELETRR